MEGQEGQSERDPLLDGLPASPSSAVVQDKSFLPMQCVTGVTSGVSQLAPSSPITPSKSEKFKRDFFFLIRNKAKRSVFRYRPFSRGNGSYLRWGPRCCTSRVDRLSWRHGVSDEAPAGSGGCRHLPRPPAPPPPIHLPLGAGGSSGHHFAALLGYFFWVAVEQRGVGCGVRPAQRALPPTAAGISRHPVPRHPCAPFGG